MNILFFDDYQLGEEIGSGTVGTIYRAVCKETGEVFALKILSSSVTNKEIVVTRFEREMVILARLNHPNIVRYYGGGKHQGKLFYVMELVEGGTLKDLLAVSGSFSWQESAECGRQLAAALQHGHNHGVIHRDLKPGNVFLRPDGQVKLGDFGIARDLTQQDITDAGLTVGTYAYMAPEVVRGERAITGQVDLYALGCVLFEMMAGRTPFVGDNFAQIFEQHLNQQPATLAELGIPCPAELDELIQSLLAKSPEDRPFNARSVQGILGELASQASAEQPNDDRAAGEVRLSDLSSPQAMLAQRIQRRDLGQRDVSWRAILALTIVLAVIIGVVLVAQPR